MKFFSYGIFLGKGTREAYGIKNEPSYATVKGYTTVGGYIVYAVPLKGATLTGLIMDVTPEIMRRIDAMEYAAGYVRISVKTTSGVDAYMYVDGNSVKEG